MMLVFTIDQLKIIVKVVFFVVIPLLAIVRAYLKYREIGVLGNGI